MTLESWQELLQELVGKPFSWNGRGPDAYDCWGIVEQVLKVLGLPVPGPWEVSQETPQLEAVRIMEQEFSGPSWRRLEWAGPGDIVAMSTHTRIHHVGVVTPYGVLHSTSATGARLTRSSRLRLLGYRRIEYYRWVG